MKVEVTVKMRTQTKAPTENDKASSTKTSLLLIVICFMEEKNAESKWRGTKVTYKIWNQ